MLMLKQKSGLAVGKINGGMFNVRDFYQELSEYVKRDVELIKRRCENSALVEIAWGWEKEKTDIIKHYRDNELYIFTLTHYQTLLEQRGTFDWYKGLIKRYGWKTMLDYGGGIGEYTIIASKMGVNMDFLEIKDSKTLKYAKWKFKKHGVAPEIFYEGHKLDKQYDCVICMDILEHVEDPEPIIKELAEHTRFIIANPDEVPYNWLFPEHISHVDLREHFEIVDRYLWERK